MLVHIIRVKLLFSSGRNSDLGSVPLGGLVKRLFACSTFQRSLCVSLYDSFPCIELFYLITYVFLLFVVEFERFGDSIVKGLSFLLHIRCDGFLDIKQDIIGINIQTRYLFPALKRQSYCS